MSIACQYRLTSLICQPKLTLESPHSLGEAQLSGNCRARRAGLPYPLRLSVERDQVVSADELFVAADITGPFAPPMPPEIEGVLGVRAKLLMAGAFSEGDSVDLDIEQHEVTWQGRPLPFELDPNEFDLLVDLAGQRTHGVPIEVVFEAAEAAQLTDPSRVPPCAPLAALAVRGVRRGKGRVVAEAEVVGWGDPNACRVVGGEALGDRIVGILEKTLLATVVGPSHTIIPPPAVNAELPVTMLLLMVTGPPPAKMPPPTNTELFARMMELLIVVVPPLDSPLDSPPPPQRHPDPPMEELFERMDAEIVAVPLLLIPPPAPPTLPDTLEKLSVAVP